MPQMMTDLPMVGQWSELLLAAVEKTSIKMLRCLAYLHRLACDLEICKGLAGFSDHIWVAIDVQNRLLPHVEPLHRPLACTAALSMKSMQSAAHAGSPAARIPHEHAGALCCAHLASIGACLELF